MCTCENNSCTWAGDLQLPIIGTNEPMMTNLYQGFSNSAKRWEVGIPLLGQVNHIFG